MASSQAITRDRQPPTAGKRLPQDDLAYTAGDRIFFEAASAELHPRAVRVLRAQAQWLNANSDFGFEIIGHADEPGSLAENVVVSLKRATAVRTWLIAAGIAPTRLRIAGLGRSDRVALCDFEACLAQNRRVVTRVMQWSPRTGFSRKSAFR